MQIPMPTSTKDALALLHSLAMEKDLSTCSALEMRRMQLNYRILVVAMEKRKKSLARDAFLRILSIMEVEVELLP